MVGVEEGWVSVCWQRGWQSRVSKGKLGRTGRNGCADVKELVVCSLEEPVRRCECAHCAAARQSVLHFRYIQLLSRSLCEGNGSVKVSGVTRACL